MRTICIMNHKGGVAKTTTAINLAAGLSRKQQKVLLIDLDPQGNIDLSLQARAQYNIYDAMTGKVPLQQCIVHLAQNFDVISSTESLTKAEYYLYNSKDKLLLKELLGTISGYDYLLIDCPPSLGIVNQSLLAFCKEVFVPTSADFLGMDALKKMKVIVQKINETYGSHCRITKVIPTMYDKRSKLCRQTLEEIKTEFNGIASTPIRINTKVKEAPKHGKSIFSYAKNSSGAEDYGKVVEEISAMHEISVH